ncbi:MAG: signal peptidase I [Clostridiales bacterium]|jgi:signal peptidase I|nr:signal peptidase I [Clostridiales bacterium]
MTQLSKGEQGTVAARYKRFGASNILFDILIVLFVITLAFGASVVLREYVVIGTRVKGISMENTVYDGDTVYLLNTKNVKKGDIIRLKNPIPEKDNSGEIVDEYLIKRVIAIGGDRLAIPGDGYVYVNGEKVGDGYTKEPGGTNYRAESDDMSFVTEGKVPDGYIFVLGDNRAKSQDSRVFGAVKTDDIRGKAFLIVRNGDWIWI